MLVYVYMQRGIKDVTKRKKNYVVENLHAVCLNILNVRTSLVRRLIISNECFTILIAMSFLPLLRPCIIREFVRRSTMGHWGKEKRKRGG